MGANPTQAIASLLFMLAFVFIAFGCYQGYGYIAVLFGMAVLAGSVALFRQAKPWETQEDEGAQK
jgi:NhaP-type Na+/H+ or K+/H+ antiporter